MNQFGSAKQGDAEMCARCESLLMDVLDGTASAGDQVFFDAHHASCTGCRRMFMDAKRGGAWLEMLRDPRPEPSAGLFERILAQTSGASVIATKAPEISTQRASGEAMIAPTASASAPSVQAEAGMARYAIAAPSPFLYARPALGSAALGGGKVIPFRVRAAVYTFGQRMLQPRLAMTAAMAFFSIALTLNLTGVHVTDLRAGNLRPSSIRRGFHETSAHVVRYYDNLRVVYELEARVHDLQRTADSDGSSSTSTGNEPAGKSNAPGTPQAAPDRDPQSGEPAEQKAHPKGPGTSLREPMQRNHIGSLLSLGSRHSTEAEQAVIRQRMMPVHDPGNLASPMHPKGDLA